MVLRYAPAVVAKQIAAEVERIEQAKSGGVTSDKSQQTGVFGVEV